MKYAWMVVAGWLMASGSAEGMISEMKEPDLPTRPGKTRFQVLKEAYSSANEVPDLNDFIPQIKTQMLCAGAFPDKPDVLNPYYIRVVKSVIQEGVPGFGPLFPPTKALYDSTVIFGNQKTVAQQNAAGFTNRITETDFEIRVDSGTYEDVSEPVVVMFRKKANYLPFKAVRIRNGTISEDAFVRGYCYQQPNS